MSDSAQGSQPAEGAWFPDPWQPDGQIRWWSGTEWTSHVHASPQIAAEVDFGEAVKRGYRGWAKFSGRASLTEYWWWFLFAGLISAVAYFVAYLAFFIAVFVTAGSTDLQPIDGGGYATSTTHVNVAVVALFVVLGLLAFVAFVLAIVIPWLAVSVRRLHDSGRSGWWLLLLLVPIGSLFVTVFLAFPSTPNTNQYGPVPSNE